MRWPFMPCARAGGNTTHTLFPSLHWVTHSEHHRLGAHLGQEWALWNLAETMDLSEGRSSAQAECDWLMTFGSPLWLGDHYVMIQGARRRSAYIMQIDLQNPRNFCSFWKGIWSVIGSNWLNRRKLKRIPTITNDYGRKKTLDMLPRTCVAHCYTSLYSERMIKDPGEDDGTVMCRCICCNVAGATIGIMHRYAYWVSYCHCYWTYWKPPVALKHTRFSFYKQLSCLGVRPQIL